MHMIHREERNGLVVLRIEHGKVNALDLELLLDLAERFAELRRELPPAVVLTGTGSSFSAGVDLSRLLLGGREYLDRFLPAMHSAFRSLFEFPRPVVAAINGHAIAGGCIITCACDYRMMAEGTGRIGVTELLVGVPFPALALDIIRRCVAPQHLQTIVYTGRTCLPPEALTVGFVDEVVSPGTLLDRACDMATRLAGISPRAFELTKAQIRGYGRHTEADIADTWASAETRQIIDAYLQRIKKK
jgi:enoyl-CoA hydratase